MKTVVFQSFRTANVPDWIARCMASVRGWSQARGFDYRFLDDAFLELPPAWFRERCTHLCTVTDLARLLSARELLERYERAVWVDADMLVFDPAHLQVPEAFAACFELWPALGGDGRLVLSPRINNSLLVFVRGGYQLEMLTDAAFRIAEASGVLGKLSIGTNLLTNLGQAMPLNLLRNVGMFSPLLMQDIAAGAAAYVPGYAGALPMPLAAANLCHSLVGAEHAGATATDATCDAVLAACLQSCGEVLNRFVARQP